MSSLGDADLTPMGGFFLTLDTAGEFDRVSAD